MAITQPGDGSITDPGGGDQAGVSPGKNQPPDDQQANNDNSSNDSNSAATDPGGDEEHPQGVQNYICVLEGPGQSNRLGYADEKLVEKTGALKDVCMSEYACEKIVSMAFKVKHPKFEGFCKNQGAHSVRMTDKQLSAMIDELLK